MTYRELYQQAKKKLVQAGKENPAFDAFCLFSMATGFSRQQYVIHSGEEAHPEQVRRLFSLIGRRARGEPLQYLLGEWEFMGLPFYVGEGVLVPRNDTEILVEEAARLLRENGGKTALDLCGGSGAAAIGLAFLCPQAKAVSVELSDSALAYLQKNIVRNRMEKRVSALRGDVLYDADLFPDHSFDLLLSNPPYIPTGDLAGLQIEVQREPRMALDGGEDGLLFYRAIVRCWLSKLRPGGGLAVEVGIHQAEGVAALFAAHRLKEVQVLPDLAGIPRVVSGKIA